MDGPKAILREKKGWKKFKPKRNKTKPFHKVAKMFNVYKAAF